MAMSPEEFQRTYYKTTPGDIRVPRADMEGSYRNKLGQVAPANGRVLRAATLAERAPGLMSRKDWNLLSKRLKSESRTGVDGSGGNRPVHENSLAFGAAQESRRRTDGMMELERYKARKDIEKMELERRMNLWAKEQELRVPGRAAGLPEDSITRHLREGLDLARQGERTKLTQDQFDAMTKSLQLARAQRDEELRRSAEDRLLGVTPHIGAAGPAFSPGSSNDSIVRNFLSEQTRREEFARAREREFFARRGQGGAAVLTPEEQRARQHLLTYGEMPKGRADTWTPGVVHNVATSQGAQEWVETSPNSVVQVNKNPVQTVRFSDGKGGFVNRYFMDGREVDDRGDPVASQTPLLVTAADGSVKRYTVVELGGKRSILDESGKPLSSAAQDTLYAGLAKLFPEKNPPAGGIPPANPVAEKPAGKKNVDGAKKEDEPQWEKGEVVSQGGRRYRFNGESFDLIKE